MSAMDLMLDTNILLDHIASREPFCHAARTVCLLGVVGEANLYISTNVLADAHYFLRKSHGSIDAQKLIEDTLSFLQPVALAPEDVSAALFEKWTDFEDCLVAQCAQKIRADYIITRNTKDFAKSRIAAVSPDELFEMLERKGFSYEEISY